MTKPGPKKKKEKLLRRSIAISKDEWDWICKRAGEKDWSASAYVRMVIRCWKNDEEDK